MIKVKQKKNTFSIVLFVLCVIAIAATRLIHMEDLVAPSILHDEAGYWSHAANLAGLNWKEVLWLWYSYGYSLLLTPLFWFTHNVTLLYRMAIVENILMAEAGFVLGILTIRKIEPDTESYQAIGFSMIASSYSAYMLQSQAAWSETLIYVCFLVVLYTCARFLSKQSLLNTILFSLAVGILYIIHNRNLATIAALFVFAAVLLIKKQIRWKHVGIMIGVLAMLYLADIFIKKGMSVLMWDTTNGFGGNDMASNSWKIETSLSSLGGVKMLLISIFGKLWYLLASTFCLGFVGLLFLVWPSLKMVFTRECSTENAFALFLLLASLATMAVCSISMQRPSADRLDILVYGRYTDMLSGPLIMAAFIGAKKEINGKRLLHVSLLSLALLIFSVAIVQYGINQYVPEDAPFYSYVYVCVPGIVFFNDMNILKITCAAGLGFCAVMLVMTADTYPFLQKPPVRKSIQVLLILMLCLPFFRIYQKAYDKSIGYYQGDNRELFEQVQLLSEYSDYPIFVTEGLEKTQAILDHEDYRSRWSTFIRLFASESDVIYALPSEYNSSDYFLVVPEGSTIGVKAQCRVVAKAKEYTILAHGEACDRLKADGYKLKLYKVAE